MKHYHRLEYPPITTNNYESNMAKIHPKNIVKSWGPSGCGKTTTMRMAEGHEVVLPARLVVRSLIAHRNMVGVPA